ncbi:NUDIX domain-containing protein [Methyloversatilis sp.]|uniref:NUDIX domain-containing protein n=1 Tax=Methyloversatilis sp. TaxID=2569862 RepID=UPI0035B22345
MSEDLTESTLDSRQVYDGVLLKVFQDQVLLPDGRHGIREYIRHPGAVVIIALLDDGRMLFERQFRYGPRRVFLEFPAGKIDAGEPVEQTAIRELREETGYEADHWAHLGTMHPCIGYSDERIEIFLARGLRHVGASLDEGEFLEITTLSLEAVMSAVWRGELTDAKTLSALHWAQRVITQGF